MASRSRSRVETVPASIAEVQAELVAAGRAGGYTVDQDQEEATTLIDVPRRPRTPVSRVHLVVQLHRARGGGTAAVVTLAPA